MMRPGERERLRAEEAERRALLETAAAELSGARRAGAADRLMTAVNGELEPLGLPAGSFGVATEAVDIGRTVRTG